MSLSTFITRVNDLSSADIFRIKTLLIKTNVFQNRVRAIEVNLSLKGKVKLTVQSS